MCRDMNECLGNQLELIEEHQKLAYLNHADICSIFIPKRMKLSTKVMEVLETLFQQEHA